MQCSNAPRSSLLAPVLAMEFAIVCPFPREVVGEEHAAPHVPSPAAIKLCGDTLRSHRGAWTAMVAHLPACVIGSMAHELVVMVMPDGRPNLMLTPQDAAAAAVAVRKRLAEHTGYEPAGCAGSAQHLVHTLASCNARVIRALWAEYAACPPAAGPASLVFRVCLKSIHQLAANLKVGKMWFVATHANACVVNVGSRVMEYLEPAGSEVVRGVKQAVANAVLGGGPHNPAHYLVLGADGRSSVSPSTADPPNSQACTVWSALGAMVALANPVAADEEFAAVMAAAHKQRHWDFRLFVRHFYKCTAPGIAAT